MKKKFVKFVALIALVAAFSGCTILTKTMREPTSRVNLNKSDFSLSEQVTGEAKTVRIIGIDWERISTQKSGAIKGKGSSSITLASIPVIGDVLPDKTTSYSLYELMNNNPGYDVVFYPQFETKVFRPILGLGVLYSITTVKTTARLGKLNK